MSICTSASIVRQTLIIYFATMEKQVNDRMVANMLNEARSCGMFVEELGDLITEYIASDAETE